MIKGEGVGQEDPRQERAQAPRIPIHVDGASLGLKRTELAECPPADDRNKQVEEDVFADSRLGLGERIARALTYMRDIRLFPNGMSKPDRNIAPSEREDEKRRTERVSVKLIDGGWLKTTETPITGRRARFEATKATPIPEVEKSADDEKPDPDPEDETEHGEIYAASKDNPDENSLAPRITEALAEANRIGPMYMPIEICSLDEMAEHDPDRIPAATEQDLEEAFEAAETAADLRS